MEEMRLEVNPSPPQRGSALPLEWDGGSTHWSQLYSLGSDLNESHGLYDCYQAETSS